MTTADLTHDPELVRSFDDTAIAVRRLGSGDGTPLLICNAVGTNLAVWRRVLADLAVSRPAITWDLRGLFGSAPAQSNRIDPAAHAEDAMAVLDHFGVQRCSVLSWASGTRIGLEIAARYPETVDALVMVCGGYGHPISRIRYLEPGALLPTVVGVLKHFASFLEGPLDAFTARPELAGLIRQSGMIAASADTAALVDLLRGMAECDLQTMLATYEAVAGDPAPEILAEIRARVLLVAGTKDPLAPVRMLREVADNLPGARLEVYEGATHYLPIEFPARLAHDIENFLGGERAFGTTPARES